MKIYLFYIFCFCTLNPIYGQTDLSYDAKSALDIECKEGIKVSSVHYQILDSIMSSFENEIPISSINGKYEALNVCIKIDSILQNVYHFKFIFTELLSEGLEKKQLDCNYYTLLYYTFLNKKKNLPVYPVIVPGHMFIRWRINEKDFFDFETTQGRETTDAEYDSIFNISDHAKENHVYLNDMNDDQFRAINYIEIANSIPEKTNSEKLALCEKALSADSNCVLAFLMKARIYENTNNDQKAFENYQRILVYDSLNYRTYNDMAILFSNRKDIDNAIKYYSKAITCCPNNPELYLNRAEEYFNKGSLEETMKDFENASENIKRFNFFQFANNYSRILELENKIMVEYLKKNKKK